MNLFKKIDHILAGLGNVKAMQRTHVDTYTENLIENISGEKIAESNYGQLFVEFQELNGYMFMNIVILSHTNIKTFKGGTLVFTSENNTLTLKSDTEEIETDFSNVSNRCMTPISFIVEPSEMETIKARAFDKVSFQFKKKELPFLVVKTRP
ncbi:MAG: hypothetical protein KDD13_08065 [Mangrovimonas sp.]|nr:hypothetical protein [Mangrovimonas sp.]